jgi:hypothetical protein
MAKTYEVRKLPGIARAALQTLKNNGTIPVGKIGRVVYYDPDDVYKVLE